MQSKVKCHILTLEFVGNWSCGEVKAWLDDKITFKDTTGPAYREPRRFPNDCYVARLYYMDDYYGEVHDSNPWYSVIKAADLSQKQINVLCLNTGTLEYYPY